MGAAVLTAIGDVDFPDQLCQRDSQFVAQPNIQKPGLERSSDGQSCASTRNPQIRELLQQSLASGKTEKVAQSRRKPTAHHRHVIM